MVYTPVVLTPVIEEGDKGIKEEEQEEEEDKELLEADTEL